LLAERGSLSPPAALTEATEPPDQEVSAVAESTFLEPEPEAATAVLHSELDIRRRVERVLVRELAEPSEDLVRFVSARLGVDPGTPAAAVRVAELCRRALREVGRERLPPTRSPRRSLERLHLDRRRVERALPGYYLG
jgi:hypothetical protein